MKKIRRKLSLRGKPIRFDFKAIADFTTRDLDADLMPCNALSLVMRSSTFSNMEIWCGAHIYMRLATHPLAAPFSIFHGQ